MKRTPYLLKCAGTLFLLLAAACGGPNTTVTPAVQSGATPQAPGTNVSQGAAQPTATTAVVIPTTAAPSGAKPGGGPVALQVVTPQDGALVNTPQIQVSGTASAGAVVTVNDAIILVGADGTFTSTVSLDQGPNLIEVIASSDSGDTKTVDLTVTYQP